VINLAAVFCTDCSRDEDDEVVGLKRSPGHMRNGGATLQPAESILHGESKVMEGEKKTT